MIRRVAMAVALSLLAGFVDALGFMHLGGYFVSFMSGNSTQMAAVLPERRQMTVRTLASDGRVYVSVVGRGPGFPLEMHDKLFEPYFTTKAQGLGLGLSISRSIVLAHGGRLWGVSTAGRGATFHIALPAVGP